jgi:hypothetical protein
MYTRRYDNFSFVQSINFCSKKNPSEIVHAIVFRGRLMKMNNLLSIFMHPHAYNNYTSLMVDLYYSIVFYR